ncbi:WASH complex subunit 3-like [Strongylocentrotus purpuratus]|uniref:WASH complex subunit 3 n=1 Tax=Strongylocentrotus purpuratus TaxID=7668 RepID=A0A7M7T076_STRPU|nr:WASH complex subunit 3-like [Strongylocentrotus purpuratus]
MDADGLPLVGPGVDLTKVGAIHSKRMLAFLNHFIIHTTRFLNKFSCVCETKLSDITTRIQRLETTVNILEAKLASIPGLENVTLETTPPPAAPEPSNLPALPSSEPADGSGIPAIEATPEPAPAVMTVSQDPRYIKYFKMINMGVPVDALKQRVLLDCLDPAYLDTPNAPAPPVNQESDSDDFSSQDNSSDDDFSD